MDDKTYPLTAPAREQLRGEDREPRVRQATDMPQVKNGDVAGADPVASAAAVRLRLANVRGSNGDSCNTITALHKQCSAAQHCMALQLASEVDPAPHVCCERLQTLKQLQASIDSAQRGMCCSTALGV